MTNPSRWNTSSEPQRAHVRRLFGVLLKRQEEIRVTECVRVSSVLELKLSVDVLHHLGVVVVEAWYDNFVEVNDDDIAVDVDIT